MSLRITGLYFALVTLAYGTMAEDSLFNIPRSPAASAGQAAPKPAGFASDLPLLLPVPGLPGRRALRRLAADDDQGRAGRCSAIRENPRVAASFGTDVKRLHADRLRGGRRLRRPGRSAPGPQRPRRGASQFEFQLALVFVIMTVVGGLRSRAGVVVGSAFFSLTDYLFDKLHLAGGRRASRPRPICPRSSPRIVLGPLLLLFTLTRHPGGFGEHAPARAALAAGRALQLARTPTTPKCGSSDVRA